MCVTRHSRQPPSVRVDIFVNTSAIQGAFHFIWHFLFSSAAPPLQLHLLFMKSHLHSHYNKCQHSKEPTCFSVTVITRNVSRCCIKNCPLPSLHSLWVLHLCCSYMECTESLTLDLLPKILGINTSADIIKDETRATF